MAQQLGLIGRDISYSLSPRIHEASARHLGIQAAYRLYDLATPESVREFLDEAWRGGMTGLNVTQPWKKLFGGQPVNTLFREQGKPWWSMTSTDAAGFFTGIEQIGCRKELIRQAIFLGSGGVVDAIMDQLACRVDCLARTPGQATRERQSMHPWDPRSLLALLENSGPGTILIQATPAPLRGDKMTEFAKALRASGRNSGLWFIDLCYGKTSGILDVALEAGIPAQDGLPMLVGQARASQEIWWGKSAPYQVILDAIPSR